MKTIVLNKSTEKIEAAKEIVCPRCKGFGSNFEDTDFCTLCNGYGDIFQSKTSGWVRAKWTKLDQSVLY